MNEYIEDVKADLLETIKDDPKSWEDLSIDGYRDRLSDPCYTDGVTGNGSGSYTYNTAEAEEIINARGLLFDDEFLSRLEDYGATVGEILGKGAEAVDVWARCIALESLSDEELEDIRAEALEAEA